MCLTYRHICPGPLIQGEDSEANAIGRAAHARAKAKNKLNAPHGDLEEWDGKRPGERPDEPMDGAPASH